MNKPDLSQFPLSPGVYLYKDKQGKIIYVGKAIKLRNRLASYFRPEEALTPKTRIMLQHAESIDILQTATEKEALLLEASLIKKHRPRYNICLRDDKEYIVFRMQTQKAYPRLEMLRKSSLKNKSAKERQGKFYGPFSSGIAAKETWRLIHRSFPLRRCRDRAFANRTRTCLYHHMGQCLGPCVEPVSEKEYGAMIRKVDLLLTGRSTELMEQLYKDMMVAAEDLAFEKAALLRDQIEAVKRTVERQSVVLPQRTNIDVIGVAEANNGLALGGLFVRDGLLLDGRNFFWQGLTMEEMPELLESFLAQFYLTGKTVPPSRIIVPWLPEHMQVVTDQGQPDERGLEGAGGQRGQGKQGKQGDAGGLADIQPKENEGHSLGAKQAPQPSNDYALRVSGLESDEYGEYHSHDLTPLQVLAASLGEVAESCVSIATPTTPDEDRLAILAAQNASEEAKKLVSLPMPELLEQALKAPAPVITIEAVDISHTGGRNTRAGMVVFENGQPLKNAYRQYALDEGLEESGYTAGDDYAALYLWAKRRASAGAPWPDLVLVDGGKGQLSAVKRAFEEEGVLNNFHLAAITKARDEDGLADRRAGNIQDRIFLPGRSNPLPLKAGSPELLYLQRVRDTVHDYVIGRHRQARSKAALTGELTRLPGIGPKTALLLYEQFGSLAAMAEAGEGGLQNVPGIGAQKAKMLAQRLESLLGDLPKSET